MKSKMNSRLTQSGRKVLYVEDEVIVALDVADGLRDELGFDVTIAHNLRTAASLAESLEFDFALLDVNLGNNERSYELGAALRNKGVRVVFASGYDRAAISDLKGYVVVEKPFKLDEIRHAFMMDETAAE